MSATSAPFGLRPAFHPSGLDRAQALAGGITSTYSSNIFKGQPVLYSASAGVIIPVTTTGAWSGAFAGVEWTDTTGRRRVSNYWPASTAGTAIVAYFYNDLNIVYEIQANGSLDQTSVGDQANLSNTTSGSNTTGLSQCPLSTTLAGAGNTAQMLIRDLAPYPDNAWGDAYTVVRVTINKSQYNATVNAI